MTNPCTTIHLNTTPSQLGVRWECPICLVVPKFEIFQCCNGHSICSFCASRVTNCPNCRVTIGENKTRNYLAEELLDSTKLKCCWNGCNDQLSRRVISEHEEKCPHNPSALKICWFIPILINHQFLKHDNFQYTLESMRDARNIEHLLDHFKYEHGYQEAIIKLGTTVWGNLCLDNLKDPDPNNSTKEYSISDLIPPVIYTMEYDNKRHLFLRVNRVDKNEDQERMYAFLLIHLTPAVGGLDTFKIHQFFRSAPSKASNIWRSLEWDPTFCTTTISWTTHPMRIDQYIKLREKPVDMQTSFPSRMPISHLLKYYSAQNNEIAYGFTVTIN